MNSREPWNLLRERAHDKDARYIRCNRLLFCGSISTQGKSLNDGRSCMAMAGLVQALALNRNVKFCAFDADAPTWSKPDDQGRDSTMTRNPDEFIGRAQLVSPVLENNHHEV